MDWDDIRMVRIHARAAEAEIVRLNAELEALAKAAEAYRGASEMDEHCDPLIEQTLVDAIGRVYKVQP